MAIRNINAIVDKQGFDYLNNADFITKYYNEALANQGQRNTEERVIGYTSFTISSMLEKSGESNLITNQKYIHLSGRRGGTITTPWSQEIIGEATNDHVLALNQKNIIYKLFEKILVEEEYPSTKDTILHIPVNYKFEYIYDGVNETIIYGANKDIYIYNIPTETIHDEEYFENDSDFIYLIDEDIEFTRTSVYSFSIEFDGDYSKGKIEIIKKFTLPYIATDEGDHHLKKWFINGVNTQVVAEPKDAMNLNLILLRSYDDNGNLNFEVLSGLNNYAQIVSHVEERKDYYIKGSDDKLFRVKLAVPEFIKTDYEGYIYDENIEEWNKIVSNSTIIIISRIDDATYYQGNDDITGSDNNITGADLEERYGKDGLIATLWTFNSSTQKIEPISIESTVNGYKVILDFGRLGNFSSLIDYKANQINQINPDNFLYRHLIFDNVSKDAKQETNDNGNIIHPVIQNLLGTKYASEYYNKLNFSLRYLIKVNGTSGDSLSIDNLKNDSAFFTPSTKTAVTSSLYKYTINNGTSNYAEYVPNYDVPMFDLSEILLKDSNVINKQNILSFDSSGNTYYAYIGSSFNEYNKNILHIGTYTTNINLGIDTLTTESDRKNFKLHDTLSIDLENILLNGKTYVNNDIDINGVLNINKYQWNISKVGSLTTKSMIFIPKFKFSDFVNPYTQLDIIENEKTNESNIIQTLKNLDQTLSGKPKEVLYQGIIFCHKIGNNYYYYKHNDLLYIPNLIKTIFGNDYTFNSITSDTNEIITISNQAKFLISSGSEICKYIDISTSSNNQTAISISNPKSGELYTNNSLDIIVFENNGVRNLVINEHKSNVLSSIWKLPTKL